MCLNFIGHENWSKPTNQRSLELFNAKVTVLRSILFFYSEQKTTLDEIQKYFTTEAINKLINDKFIEIHG